MCSKIHFMVCINGRSSGAIVVGLATTNSREAIADKADYVIDDFRGMTYEKLLTITSRYI